MKKTFVTFIACLLLSGCGGAGSNSNSDVSKPSEPPKMTLTVYGKTQSFEPKTGMLTIGQTGSPDSEDRYAEYGINFGSIPLNSSADVNKPQTSTEDVRLLFAVARKRKTDRNSPVEAETFPANGSWPHLNDAQFKIFDGTRTIESWGHEAPSQDRKGWIKITAVNGDLVSGEVDMSFGDKITVKGPFTVKVQPRN